MPSTVTLLRQGFSRRFKTKTKPATNEGPHSTIPEDEFFDAVETGLDRFEEELRVRLRLQSQQSQISTASATAAEQQHGNSTTAADLLSSSLLHPTTTTTTAISDYESSNHNDSDDSDNVDSDNDIDDDDDDDGSLDGGKPAHTKSHDSNAAAVVPAHYQHRLWPQIVSVCTQQLHHARQGVGEGDSGWQLFADEGEMKMYRREEEVDGMVVDPLKACHMVQGVSAKEMCHYFFMPEYRNDWETTLEDMTILEQISPDAIVFLQTHKRIWPASQRDALFWSHMQNVTATIAEQDADVYDAWAVCNHSIEHDGYGAVANSGKCIRLFLTVILMCQTYVREIPVGRPITRDDLTCKITYCSVVNPGGWAPKTALRAVYKREYPKFLKRFTQYVVDQCHDKPIMF